MKHGDFSKLVLMVVSLLFCITCTSPAAAESFNEPEAAGIANLPVFFVTDRTVKKKGVGYKFGDQVDAKRAATAEDGLTFGIEQYFTTVPWSATLAGNGSFQDVCQSTINAVKSEPTEHNSWRTMYNNGRGSLYGWSDRDRFFSHLSSSVSKCPEKELIVFVHGCCVDHDKAVKQTLGLQKWYRRPVLLFDWTTVNMVYFQSLRSYPKSQDRFNLLVRELRERMPNVKVTVIAFSVGTNIVKNYCLNPAVSVTGSNPAVAANGSNSDVTVTDSISAVSEPSFDGLVFLRGDADSCSFQKELPAMARHSRRPLQIWVASNDFNIIVSRFIRRTVNPFKNCSPRVGQLKAWHETPKSTDAQRSGEPGATAEGSGGSIEKSVEAAAIFDGIEVMDVSELRLGHRIPYRLLALASRRQLIRGDLGPFSIDEIATRVFKAHERNGSDQSMLNATVSGAEAVSQTHRSAKNRALVTTPGVGHK